MAKNSDSNKRALWRRLFWELNITKILEKSEGKVWS